MTKQEKDAIIKLLKSGNVDMFHSAGHLITALYPHQDDIFEFDDEGDYNLVSHRMYSMQWELEWDEDGEATKRFGKYLKSIGVQPITQWIKQGSKIPYLIFEESPLYSKVHLTFRKR